MGTAARVRRVTVGLFALLLVASGLTWWWWPAPRVDATTTDAPVPTPVGAQAPMEPTHLLWRTGEGDVAVHNGYAINTSTGVAVHDLFTGEERWHFRDRSLPVTELRHVAGDRVTVRFSGPDQKFAYREFDLPSGVLLGTRNEANPSDPDRQPGAFTPGDISCREEIDEAHDQESDTLVMLLGCGDSAAVAGLDPATRTLRWQTPIPISEPSPDEPVDGKHAYLAGVGHGLAVIEVFDGESSFAMQAVDVAAGDLLARVPLGSGWRHDWGFVPYTVVPDGWCMWGGPRSGLEQLSCFDGATGALRWERSDDAIDRSDAATLLAVDDEAVLALTFDFDPRLIGYRLADGQPFYDVDLSYAAEPEVLYHGQGVLALSSPLGWFGQTFAVYGEAP